MQILDAAQFLDFPYDLLYGMHDFVCMCNGWIGDLFVLEVNCVGEPFFFCVFDVACMHACDSELVTCRGTIRPQNGIAKFPACLTFRVSVLHIPLVLMAFCCNQTFH